MSIVVNPYTPEEELTLLEFLDRMKYDYMHDSGSGLSKTQLKEILNRDKAYEAGETTIYSLNEVIAHFNIKE